MFSVNIEVDVLNISLATPIYDQDLHEVVKEAVDNGITIVASAGNNSDNENYYPAAFNIPGVISVASINLSNDILYESTVNEHVDIFAPGEDIYTFGRENLIEKFSGTSVSTPIVTSLVILLKAKCKGYEPRDIENIIKEGASIYTGSWKNTSRSISLINFEKTLELCENSNNNKAP
ncbi:S8 family peptidase [Niallia sp. 03133]|uniref:S8 family peptidase n=1 Tax=Niallia sp. 03133 TaxID=3458060 RepID=UPI0040441BAC